MGTAVRARCPRSPARHDRPAGAEERSINLGLNPFHCPLPDWADEVHATCRQAEITELEPAVGPSAGGTLVTVTGSNLGSGLPGAGCLFGKSAGAVWVPAVEANDARVVCATPPRRPGETTPSVVVRVGHEGGGHHQVRGTLQVRRVNATKTAREKSPRTIFIM